MFIDVFLDKKHLDRHVRVWLVFKSIRPVQRNQFEGIKIKGEIKTSFRRGR